MPRVPDRVVIETDRGVFDRFQRVELVQDIFDVAAASFEIGDDGSWRELERIVAPGEPFRIYLYPGGADRRLMMTGRAEVNEVPCSAEQGTVVELVCRTKLSDARYASADPKVRFTQTTIKDFILALFAPLGYGESDFVFSDVGDADLVTGAGGGKTNPKPLEPIKQDQLKVNPPETIFEAAARVLRRHHALLYDAADGRIIVGAPDGEAGPRFSLRCRRGAASVANNVLRARRVRDWSEVASDVWVFGGKFQKDATREPVGGHSVDEELVALAQRPGRHFFRPVYLPADASITKELAQDQARRERMARAQRKDAWELEVDGWTCWDGTRAVPLHINVVADVDVETVGGSASGRYLVTRLVRSLSADEGAHSSMTLVTPSALEI